MAQFLGFGLALALLTGPDAWAADPDTRQMIEALMPATPRSMRNLVVRRTPPDPAATSAASAALAAEPTSVPVSISTEPAADPSTASGSAPAADTASVSVPASGPTTVSPPPGGPAPTPAPPSLSLAIQFERNSPHVRPESGPLLGNLVAAMQSPELRSARFVIEGHTDASGAPALNQRLSQERADEVRLYLIALGVQAARLRAVGKGAAELADPQDPLGAENRRVRVVTVQ